MSDDDVPSCRVIRQGHDCCDYWPIGQKIGTIIRCECGKRWIVVERTATTCYWSRRVWPWPR